MSSSPQSVSEGLHKSGSIISFPIQIQYQRDNNKIPKITVL